MNLLSRKIPLFCVSNILVSFMCTNFMGITYSDNREMMEQNNNQVTETSSEVEPASRIGDSNNKKVEVKKKTTTKKSVVKKKEVATSVKYTPAKYNSVTGNAVVEYAKRYLGLRYVSAGNSLTKGTDCSGFTKLIYKEFGVTLSRTVKGQMGNGTYVRKSDLQKGDLVFYGSGNGVASHVAMYIGNGKVIHESNHRDGVKISTVNMMQYITARRVINSKANKIAEQKLEEANKALEVKKDDVVTDTSINNTIENKENVDNNQSLDTSKSTTTETKVESKSNDETIKENSSDMKSPTENIENQS